MGEIADWLVDQMADEGWFPPGDPYRGRGSYTPAPVECNRCGKSGLHWEDDNGEWVLVDKHNEIHRCTVAAKEFEGL